MTSKTLQTLEYSKIITALTTHASSPAGKALCEGLLPMTDISKIEAAQSETAAALTRLFQKGSLSFQGNRSLTPAVRSLEVGSALSINELLQVADLLECAGTVKAYGRPERNDAPVDCLNDYFEALVPLSNISTEIRRIIIADGRPD